MTLHGLRPVALLLLWLACIPAGLADAWHQFGQQDAYWHHGSGWIFPGRIGEFELVRTPYQIDGNDDVGAQYEMVVNGMPRTAEVVIYYPNSAAIGARLDTARAAMQSSSANGKPISPKRQGKFAIERRLEIVGVRTIYSSQDVQRGLYFFQTPNWVVTIRTQTQAADIDATKALNAFVQEQRWDTLGTDAGRYR